MPPPSPSTRCCRLSGPMSVSRPIHSAMPLRLLQLDHHGQTLVKRCSVVQIHDNCRQAATFSRPPAILQPSAPFSRLLTMLQPASFTFSKATSNSSTSAVLKDSGNAPNGVVQILKGRRQFSNHHHSQVQRLTVMLQAAPFSSALKWNSLSNNFFRTKTIVYKVPWINENCISETELEDNFTA